MGVLDTTVKQLILVKADTSQAKQAIKELSGEEKKAAKERLDDIERQNSKLESSVRSWTKVAAGVAGAVAAYKLMSKAAEAAIEDAKRSGTAGEGAAKAWTDATKKWDAAVNQLMVSFGNLVIKLSPLVDLMAELVNQIALAVELLNHPQKAAEDFISLGQALGSVASQAMSGKRSYSRMALDMGSKLASKPYALGVPDDFFTVEHMEKNRGIYELYNAGIFKVQDAWGALAEKLNKKRGKGIGRTTEGDIIGDFSQLFQTNMSAGGEVFGALSRTYQDARKGTTLGTEDQTGLARLRATLEQAKRDVAQWNDEVAQMQAARRQSFLESIFGPIEQFNVYAAAFNLLQSSVSAAFDAWITGQSSVGEAVKAAVATGLKAVAIDAGIQAIKNTAYGFAALASGPIGGVSAGGYFKAAAMFTGVAAVAGLASKQMHAAGWAGGNSSSPTGGGGGGGAGGFLGGGDRSADSGGPNQVTVMLGSDFGMLTTLEQKQLLGSAIRLGLNQTRGTKRIRRGA